MAPSKHIFCVLTTYLCFLLTIQGQPDTIFNSAQAVRPIRPFSNIKSLPCSPIHSAISLVINTIRFPKVALSSPIATTRSRGLSASTLSKSSNLLTISPQSTSSSIQDSFLAGSSINFIDNCDTLSPEGEPLEDETVPSLESLGSTNASDSFSEACDLTILPISIGDAKTLSKMESSLFQYFVENEPVTLPKVTYTNSNSSTKRKRRLLERCIVKNRLDIDIYFHYVRSRKWNSSLASEERVKQQMEWMNRTYHPLGIFFHYQPKIRRWMNKNVSEHVFTDDNDAIKTNTHVGGRPDLNVWLVDSINASEDTGLSGYATLPGDQYNEINSIIMDQAMLGNTSTTLIHETGHWLGLWHTFRETGKDCISDDELLDTTQTSGNPDTL
ncbi:MAG: hypothetical protein M1834_003950 [Cirrosporium novae-zelandiae]|nr:MAG: hypothetical protein M1834_003950 [Cirrosporium novae-zelandiae]